MIMTARLIRTLAACALAACALPAQSTAVGTDALVNPNRQCGVVAYAARCDRPWLWFAPGPGGMQVWAIDCEPNVPAKLIIGWRRTQLPMPGNPHCLLHTEIALFAPSGSDASGMVRWFLPIPPSVSLTFNVQAVILSTKRGTTILLGTGAYTFSCG